MASYQLDCFECGDNIFNSKKYLKVLDKQIEHEEKFPHITIIETKEVSRVK